MGSTLAPKPASDRKHAVSLMRLRQAQCRFIISAPEQKPMFCGEATNGGSWCAGHRSIVYLNEQPVSPQAGSRQSAQEVSDATKRRQPR
jgi:hypothetical protein